MTNEKKPIEMPFIGINDFVLGTELIRYMAYLMNFPNQTTHCIECGQPILLQTLYKRIHRCCYTIYEKTLSGVKWTDFLEDEAYHDELMEWWDRTKCPKELSCMEEECFDCDIPNNMFAKYLQNGRVEQIGNPTNQ